MRSGIDLARTLVAKADEDFMVAEAIIARDLPLPAACFHLQQAAGKLLKAALSSRGVDFPFTHDARHLLGLVVPLCPEVEEFREPLPRLHGLLPPEAVP